MGQAQAAKQTYIYDFTGNKMAFTQSLYGSDSSLSIVSRVGHKDEIGHKGKS